MSRRPKVQVSVLRDLPGVLRVEIEIQEVERLVGASGESFGRGGGDAIDELRQSGVGDRGNGAFAEVEIIQAKDSRVGAEAEFVRAVAPGEIVVDEEARGAPALDPGVVEPADGGERGVRAGALQDDGKRRERLAEDRWGRTGCRTRRTPD